MKIHTAIMSIHINNRVSESQSSKCSTLDHYYNESDFITGNISSPPLRDFDFSLERVPNRIRAIFDVQDREFSDVKFLSTGSNAAVYAAYRRNKYVAIKMLKMQIKNRETAVQEMLFEMQVLRKIEHPNIITVYGAGETPRKFIMLEYLGGGTLESLLRSHQDQVHQRMGLQSNIVGLSWELALPIVLELASALKYLHVDFLASAVLIHRDLKPQNIGFTADKKLKLFDFGLAVCVKKNRTHDATYRMTGNTGTISYMAPEVALSKPYNEKVDVYSFAIVLWQLLSGEKLYPDLTREAHMQQVVLGGERLSLLPIMARAPIGVANLIEQCWNADHTMRPDFTTILRTLTDFTAEASCSSAGPSNTEKTVIVSSKKRNFLSLRNFFPLKIICENSSSSAMPLSGSTGSSSSDGDGSGGIGSKEGVKDETARVHAKIVVKPVSLSTISGQIANNIIQGSGKGSTNHNTAFGGGSGGGNRHTLISSLTLRS